jgi:hypothetical protein
METWYELSTEYTISNTGRVKHNDRELKLDALGTAYMWGKRIQMHKYMAEAFVGPSPHPKAVVRCRDGNRANVSAENLYWARRPRWRRGEKWSQALEQ